MDQDNTLWIRPYLEPGENRLQVFLDGTETAEAAFLSYRPAFL